MYWDLYCTMFVFRNPTLMVSMKKEEKIVTEAGYWVDSPYLYLGRK